MKILIVEDNPVNLDLVMQLLEDDYELLTAEDGEEGLRLAVSGEPNLILLDLSLPKINGWDVCKAIRADENARSLPVIALTAHAIKGDREKALEAGFDDYVTKPIDDDELFSVIEKYLK